MGEGWAWYETIEIDGDSFGRKITDYFKTKTTLNPEAGQTK